MAGELCTSGQDYPDNLGCYTLSHCLHTVNVTVECIYNVVFFFCPVGVDDTAVLGKLC